MSSLTATLKTTSLAGLVIGVLLTSGCGGSAPRNAYAYVTQLSDVPPGSITPPTGGLAELHVAEDGTLTQIGQASFPMNKRPYTLLTHPSGKYLLAGYSDGNAYEFTIENDGTLSANPVATINPPAQGDWVYPLGYTPDGRFVATVGTNFTSNNSGGETSYTTLNSYQLDSVGTPTLVSTLTMTNDLMSTALDPSGKYLYATSYDNLISEYALSSSGVLSFVGSVPISSINCANITISPNEFLYCESNGPPGDTIIFSIDPSTGALTPTSTYVTGQYLSFQPSGGYAYAFAPFSQYTIDSLTGALTPNGPTIADTCCPVIDPSGKFALVFSAFDTVSSYTIGPDGELTLSSSLALDQNSLAQRMFVARH